MSFAQSLNGPAAAAFNGARALLHGRTLASMARAVGVVLGAGMLAASYQIVYEEGRELINNVRSNVVNRRQRNDAVVLTLMMNELPLPALDTIRRSRNAFRTAMELLTDEKTPEEYRAILRTSLHSLVCPPRC